jgi:hypothetical protein
MEVKIQALSARASAAAESWLERAAWQKAFVEPAFSRCAATLRAADGVTSEAARAPGEELLVVAVAGIGGGVICPSGIAADGRVVVLESPVACYGTKECDCALSAVLPGAVLGPELPLAEPPRAEPSPPTTPGAEAAPSPTPAPDDEPLD